MRAASARVMRPLCNLELDVTDQDGNHLGFAQDKEES
jgi:hypothetical protein